MSGVTGMLLDTAGKLLPQHAEKIEFVKNAFAKSSIHLADIKALPPAQEAATELLPEADRVRAAVAAGLKGSKHEAIRAHMDQTAALAQKVVNESGVSGPLDQAKKKELLEKVTAHEGHKAVVEMSQKSNFLSTAAKKTLWTAGVAGAIVPAAATLAVTVPLKIAFALMGKSDSIKIGKTMLYTAAAGGALMTGAAALATYPARKLANMRNINNSRRAEALTHAASLAIDNAAVKAGETKAGLGGTITTPEVRPSIDTAAPVQEPKPPVNATTPAQGTKLTIDAAAPAPSNKTEPTADKAAPLPAQQSETPAKRGPVLAVSTSKDGSKTYHQEAVNLGLGLEKAGVATATEGDKVSPVKTPETPRKEPEATR